MTVEELEKRLLASGVTMEQLSSKSRVQHLVYCRVLYCHICDENKMYYKDIAARLGRDRTTIIRYQQIYRPWYKCDEQFRELVDGICR